MAIRHPGLRLRRFRESCGLSLREAARQLHVKHPSLKDWEDGVQVPVPAFRRAIEVWTRGAIRADRWPLSTREREIVAQAGRVGPAVPGRKAGAVVNDTSASSSVA